MLVAAAPSTRPRPAQRSTLENRSSTLVLARVRVAASCSACRSRSRGVAQETLARRRSARRTGRTRYAERVGSFLSPSNLRDRVTSRSQSSVVPARWSSAGSPHRPGTSAVGPQAIDARPARSTADVHGVSARRSRSAFARRPRPTSRRDRVARRLAPAVTAAEERAELRPSESPPASPPSRACRRPSRAASPPTSSSP